MINRDDVQVSEKLYEFAEEVIKALATKKEWTREARRGIDGQ